MIWKVCEECKKRYENSDTCEEDEQLCWQLKEEAEKIIKDLKSRLSCQKLEDVVKATETKNNPEIEIVEK